MLPKPAQHGLPRLQGGKAAGSSYVSQGACICISLEEGNKAGGVPMTLLSRGIFYRYQQSHISRNKVLGGSGGAAAAAMRRLAPLAWLAGTRQGALGTVPRKTQTLLIATESGWKTRIPPCAHPTSV